MKKLLSLLLILLLLTGCAAPAAQEPTTAPQTTAAPETTTPTEPDAQSSTPLLYRVTDDEGHVLYLFGSIHVGVPEMYPLPDYVLDAYQSADLIALEYDPSNVDEADEAQADLMSRLEEGTTIGDYISEETYAAALRILQETDALHEEADQYKPVIWYSTINELITKKSKTDTSLGVDLTILNMAQEDGKPVEGIESYLGHRAILTDLSMETQCMLLDGIVVSYRSPYSTRQLSYLCDLWAAGDASTMSQILTMDLTQVPQEQLALYQEYNDALSTNRDVQMTQYARDALASGKTVFICVGLAHVICPNGIMDQLIQAGYTVEQVPNAP